jgi:exopolyphosphatase/guanosine-5'-triphosphate,3'-diphosphate pyrophosphatase
MKRIMAEPSLIFDRREREIVALVARYHRKVLPHVGHEYFAALDAEDRRRVEVLAGVLRVADGLDRGHNNVVQDLQCRVSSRQITVRCQTTRIADGEFAAADKKADLMERTFGRRLVFRRVEK